MLALTSAQQEAIAKGHVMWRVYVWCDAIDLDGVTPAPTGFWDDVGVVEVEVDGEPRTYFGSGTLVTVSSLSAVGDLSIPGFAVTLSGLPPEVAALVRGSTVGQRPIEVHIGIFDVDTRELIGEVIPRFKGVVDNIEINTPEAGGTSTVVLTCESVSRALTIRRYDTRSDASQHERDASDDFYKYTAVQRESQPLFGRKAPR